MIESDKINKEYKIGDQAMNKIISSFYRLCAFTTVFSSFVLSNANAYGGMQGVKIGLSALKYDVRSEGSTLGNGEYKNTYMDYKLGYLSNTLYFGGVYSSYNRETSGSTTKRSLTGATVGYHNNGFFLDGTYYISGEVELPTLTKVKSGSGYAIELGYEVMVSSSAYLGLEGVYKSISYTKVVSSAGTESDADNKETPEIYPMLSVGIFF